VDATHRQSKLAEIGAAGQARIAASTADVRLAGLAGAVCVRYLVGCGVGALRVRDPRLIQVAQAASPSQIVVVIDDLPDERPPPLDLTDAVAREFAQGANEALRLVRAMIDLAR
jgi:hypothetical protein